MIQENAKRLIRMQEITKKDCFYRKMLEELKLCDPKLMDVLENISDEQRNVIEDYLGLCGAMHLRMVELACEHMVFADE